MATQRTVTKVIFHDSSDDEAHDGTNGPKKPLVATTYVDVRTDNLCMEPDDMVDPEEHFRRCEDIVGDDDFVEDAVPDLEKAKGTLAHNHSTAVEVDVMEAPARRTGGYAANRRPGRRPEDATSAHSTRKRLAEGDEEANDTAVAEEGGMTTDEMLSAAQSHGLPAAGAATVDALDALEEEVVKAVLLPNGTNRDPIAIKVSSEGYRLTLDEHDVQDVFEDEEGEDLEEEEDEEERELELLMAVSAIEQLMGAAERYQPNEADGGMCPWATQEGTETETTAASSAPPAAAVSSEAVAESATDGAPAEPEEAIVADGASIPTTRRPIHRPRIFDAFVTKAKDLLAKLHAKEITAESLCEAMEEDVGELQRAFRRINRPVDEPIYIDGVKMDF